MFARACGKNDVHDLEPEDLRAMTIEASAITGIPLVGTDFAFRPESFAEAVMRAMSAPTTHNGHSNQRRSRTCPICSAVPTAAHGRLTSTPTAAR